MSEIDDHDLAASVKQQPGVLVPGPSVPPGAERERPAGPNVPPGAGPKAQILPYNSHEGLPPGSPRSGPTRFSFKVVISDDVAVNAAMLRTGNILVRKDGGGYTQSAKLVARSTRRNSRSITATYNTDWWNYGGLLREVKGDSTETFKDKLQYDVQNDLTQTITGNHKHTITKNFTQAVTGKLDQSFESGTVTFKTKPGDLTINADTKLTLHSNGPIKQKGETTLITDSPSRIDVAKLKGTIAHLVTNLINLKVEHHSVRMDFTCFQFNNTPLKWEDVKAAFSNKQAEVKKTSTTTRMARPGRPLRPEDR